MNTLRSVVIIAAIVLALVPAARGQSFTFDFGHPDGTGSSFADAASLDTAGSLKDSLGQPIGFTHRYAAVTSLDGLTLTASGLEFDTSASNMVVGVPFPTDGDGTVQITVRLQDVSGMDTDYETVGVGIGEASSYAVNTMAAALTFFNSGWLGGVPIYNTRAAPNYAGDNIPAEEDVRSITLSAPTVPGGQITGIFDGATIDWTLTGTNDNLSDPRLGRADTYAYLLLGGGVDGSAGQSMRGTVTSITFSGPNVAPPPPATALTMVQSLVADVANLNVNHGIVNSLDAKLDAALHALDDLNAKDDAAAINKMDAFINAVLAQSGVWIPVADADALIAAAQEIIDLISGS